MFNQEEIDGCGRGGTLSRPSKARTGHPVSRQDLAWATCRVWQGSYSYQVAHKHRRLHMFQRPNSCVVPL